MKKLDMRLSPLRSVRRQRDIWSVSTNLWALLMSGHYEMPPLAEHSFNNFVTTATRMSLSPTSVYYTKKGLFCMKQYCGIHRNAALCQDLFLYQISIALLWYKSSSNATSRFQQCQFNAAAIRNFTSNSDIIPHSWGSGITSASIRY